MKPLLLIVLLVAVVQAAVFSPKSQAKGHVLTGKLHRRMADDLRAFQQQRRAARPHENFQPEYPDELMLADVSIYKTNQTFAVSIETNTDVLFFLDPTYPSLLPNQPTYDPLDSGGVPTHYYQVYSGSNWIGGWGYEDIVNFGAAGVWDQLLIAMDWGPYPNPPLVGFDGGLGLAWNPEDKDSPVTFRSSPVLNFFATHSDLPRFYVQWLQQGTREGQRELEWEISFGTNIHSKCTEEPLASTGLYLYMTWQTTAFTLDAFGFGAREFDGKVAAVDSGSPVIQMWYEAFVFVHTNIGAVYDFALGVWTVDCANAGKFDDFVFTIGGVQLAVPSTNYIVDLGLGSDTCVVAIESSQTISYVLGTPFQWTYCTKFDIDNSQVSFHRVINQ